MRRDSASTSGPMPSPAMMRRVALLPAMAREKQVGVRASSPYAAATEAAMLA